MPIATGSVTLTRYRVETDAKDPGKLLGVQLRAHKFEPLDRAGPEERALGFVELEDRDGVAFSPGALHQGEHAVFSLRVDEIKVPAAALKAELERWLATFERENKRPASRKEKADAKAELRHTLKSRLPIQTRAFDVSWHLSSGLLLVWAASRKAIDEVQATLEKACKLRLVPLAPATVADALELAEKSLAPTPELSGLGREEAANDEA